MKLLSCIFGQPRAPSHVEPPQRSPEARQRGPESATPDPQACVWGVPQVDAGPSRVATEPALQEPTKAKAAQGTCDVPAYEPRLGKNGRAIEHYRRLDEALRRPPTWVAPFGAFHSCRELMEVSPWPEKLSSVFVRGKVVVEPWEISWFPGHGADARLSSSDADRRQPWGGAFRELMNARLVAADETIAPCALYRAGVENGAGKHVPLQAGILVLRDP